MYVNRNFFLKKKKEKLKSKFASAGNRTRAARVAGEHSTTEPPMLLKGMLSLLNLLPTIILKDLIFYLFEII